MRGDAHLETGTRLIDDQIAEPLQTPVDLARLTPAFLDGGHILDQARGRLTIDSELTQSNFTVGERQVIAPDLPLRFNPRYGVENRGRIRDQRPDLALV